MWKSRSPLTPGSGGSQGHGHVNRNRREKPRRFFQDFDPKPYVKWVLAISLLFLVGYINQGLTKRIEFLSPNDKDKLKEVFFGNETWVVLCHNDPAKPIFEPFEGAARELYSRGLNFGVLDCAAKLPSGRTTSQRLDLKTVIQPMIFVCSPDTKKPRQLLPRYLSSKEVLVRELLAVGTPQISIVRDTRGLQEHCLATDYCLLVLKGNKYGDKEEALVQSLMREYPNVKFAQIDSVAHELSMERKLARFRPELNRAIIFHRESAEETRGKKKKKAGRLVAKAYYGDFTKKDLGGFLYEATNDKLTFRKVDDQVEVYRRSSGPPSSYSSRSPSSSPSPKPPPSTSSSPQEPPEAKAGTPELSEEELLQQQREREAAIRRNMEREMDDLIAFESAPEGEEGEDTGGSYHSDDDDLSDLLAEL